MCVRQKEQGKKLSLVNADLLDATQGYVQQRARGAYIASICQPEAAFDLSTAAQHQEPRMEEFKILNKRLKWQLKNLDRGLTYIPLDLRTIKLFVFINGSFTNNKDLSSQIRYKIIIATEITLQEEEFTILGNLIH